MKKIISAVALASLALGVATADAKITLNYRTQAVGFSRFINGTNRFTFDDYNGTATESEYFEKNIWLAQKAYGGDSDTVKFDVSSDFGGATLRIDPKASDGSETLNQMSGYVKLGPIEVGAGEWKDGMSTGAYQLKNDSDAGNYGGDTFAAYKLGSMFKGSITTFVDDIVNFAASSNSSAGYATWTGDLGDYEVTATGSLIGLGSTMWGDGDNIYSGVGLRLDVKGSIFDTQFIFKSASNKSSDEKRGFALYTQAKGLIPSTTVTLGGAAGFYKGNLTEINLDLRARYASGPLSVTFMNNVSHITNDNDYSTDIVKHVGAIYAAGDSLANVGSADDLGFNENQTYCTVMWNMLGFRYNVNDRITALFSMGDVTYLNNIGYMGKDLSADHGNWTGVELFMAPGFQLNAGKGASVVSYARFGWNHLGVTDYTKDDGEHEFAVCVPVIIRVKM